MIIKWFNAPLLLNDETINSVTIMLIATSFRYTSFTYLGGTTGTVITLPLCGILLDKYPWEVIFDLTNSFDA